MGVPPGLEDQSAIGRIKILYSSYNILVELVIGN